MVSNRLYDKARTPRRFGGESTASGFIEWLNCAIREAQQGNKRACGSAIRVLKLATLLHKHMREESAFNSDFLAEALGFDETCDFVERHSALRQQIDDMLALYRIVPMLGGKKLLRLSGRPDRKFFNCDVSGTDFVGLKESFTEADAVLSIFQLAQEGHLSLVRPCRVCESVYYSHNKRSTFCSNACRIKFYNQTEAAKQKRRENSARWRRDEKERNKRSEKAVGYKPAKKRRR
jgi:hypothetical protein